MVWTAVRGGVRGRERLTPVLDFLAVAAILAVLTGAAAWVTVWGLSAGEDLVAVLSGIVGLFFLGGLWMYLAAPLRASVVLRPETIELPAGDPKGTRVVVRWDDVVGVGTVPGEHRPALRVALRDDAPVRRADGSDDLLSGAGPGAPPRPDAVPLVDAETVARVLRHLSDHPEDRGHLARRGGVGIVLAFARPVHGDPPA